MNRRPTIAELEAILSNPNPGRVEIQPNGEVRVVPCITAEDTDLLTKLADWHEHGASYTAEFEKGHQRIARALRAALAALSQPPFRDSGSGPKGEDAPSAAECGAPQSGLSDSEGIAQ